MKILISIIVPTYNSIATIDTCLNSITKQTFTNLEVVIVDGASSDGTDNFIKTFANKDNRIVWVSKRDKGIYDAMNKGVELCNGDWVLFLGSDDYLHDIRVLEDISFFLQKTSADIVYGDAILISNKERYGGQFDILRLHILNNLCHQTIFYRRSIFNKLGKYNLSYPIYADWDFNIRCFRHTEIKTQYIQRDIVVFNNLTGVSSLPHEDSFLKEIPVSYIKELNTLKRENKELLNSRPYIIGNSIYNAIKKVGVVAFMNKLRKT